MKPYGNLFAGALASALLPELERVFHCLSLLSLAGCASANGLSPEASPSDASDLAARKALSAATLSPSAWPRSNWWTVYNDPQLDALIDEALARWSPS